MIKYLCILVDKMKNINLRKNNPKSHFKKL
jgi:hypothetical protein